MSIDEIKAISEIVQNLAQTGEQVGSNWILWHYGVQVFRDLTSTLLAIIILHIAYRMFLRLSAAGIHDTFMREMRDRLKVGCGGVLIEEEVTETQHILRQLVKDYKTSKKEA